MDLQIAVAGAFAPAIAIRLRSKSIVAEVCHRHGVGIRDIMERSRLPNIVCARNEAMFEVWRVLGWSISRVGRFFGGDHSTAAYAIGSHILSVGAEPNWMSDMVIRHRAQGRERCARKRVA